MKPIRKEVSWKFLDEFRGKIFDTTWPTLPQVVLISKERFPDRPCFVDFEGVGGSKNSLTYTQVWTNIESLAKWMTANGIKKGDRVAVSGKNSPEWATTYFAAMYAGAIAVPIDCALHEKEVDNLLATAKPKMFFVDEDKYEYFSAKKGLKVYSLSPKLEKLYVYNLRTTKSVELPKVSDKDTAAILFTSGTTGTPKGVMLSHENLVSDCFIAQQNLILSENDVFYALLPIHHGYTMQAAMICPLSSGSSIVFGKSMAVSRLMKELKEGEITLMLGVPLLYNKLYSGIKKGLAAKGKLVEIAIGALMNFSYFVKKLTGKNIGHTLLKPVLKQANLTTIRVAICGGGPLASSVFKAYQSLGIDFIQGYGLTETSPIIALNPLEHFKIESVGADFSPWEEIKIIDKNEEGVGEIVVKGPMVMQGYYNMPEETKAVFTDDGFFKTGDLGYLDDENYLILSGRAKNLIVTDGGKNVYPEEIEDAFQLYYDIEQIMVRGYISDVEHKSESIEAIIYPAEDMLKRLDISRSGSSKNADLISAINEIVSKVNKGLQPYARISKITILEEALEMTTTRKIKRNVVNKNLDNVEPLKEQVEKSTTEKSVEKTEKVATKKSASKKTSTKSGVKPKTEKVEKKEEPKVSAKKSTSKTKKVAAPKTEKVEKTEKSTTEKSVEKTEKVATKKSASKKASTKSEVKPKAEKVEKTEAPKASAKKTTSKTKKVVAPKTEKAEKVEKSATEKSVEKTEKVATKKSASKKTSTKSEVKPKTEKVEKKEAPKTSAKKTTSKKSSSKVDSKSKKEDN